jgi:uncharacterized protein YlxP (DUF503 family)|tara:strand:+ start:720 stop:1001 length:282 start_codon:yes stop_codon:yes gene_type:complete
VTIGVLHVNFLIEGARSLKDRRRVVKDFKDQIRSRFNCAIAETAYQDLRQRARLTAVVVSNESKHANSQLTGIGRFIETRVGASIVDYQIEML